jgi:hypothetical protein
MFEAFFESFNALDTGGKIAFIGFRLMGMAIIVLWAYWKEVRENTRRLLGRIALWSKQGKASIKDTISTASREDNSQSMHNENKKAIVLKQQLGEVIDFLKKSCFHHPANNKGYDYKKHP